MHTEIQIDTPGEYRLVVRGGGITQQQAIEVFKNSPGYEEVEVEVVSEQCSEDTQVFTLVPV